MDLLSVHEYPEFHMLCWLYDLQKKKRKKKIWHHVMGSYIYVCVENKKQFTWKRLEEKSLGIKIGCGDLCFLVLFLVPQEKLSHMINLELLLGNRDGPPRGI